MCLSRGVKGGLGHEDVGWLARETRYLRWHSPEKANHSFQIHLNFACASANLHYAVYSISCIYLRPKARLSKELWQTTVNAQRCVRFDAGLHSNSREANMLQIFESKSCMRKILL